MKDPGAGRRTAAGRLACEGAESVPILLQAHPLEEPLLAPPLRPHTHPQLEEDVPAQERLDQLQWVVPAALAIIFLLIYLVFRRFSEAAIILLSVPLALVGGLWLIWMLGHAISIATLIGFIALAGVAVETAIVKYKGLQN